MWTHREYVTDADEAPRAYATDAPGAVSTAWSPAQFIGLIVGVGFAVLGVVAVARSGFDTAHIYTPRVTVWHLPHTPLLAVLEIAYGALMIIASVVPGAARTLMGLLGAVALVLGIVVLAGAPARLVHWLAVAHSSGVLFTVVGAVVALTAIVSPVFAPTRRSTRRVHVVQ